MQLLPHLPVAVSLLILALASFNIANLLTREGGFTLKGEPVLFVFRRWVGVRYNEYNDMYGETFFGELFSCIFCMSRWTSAFVMVGYWLGGDMFVWVLSPLALSTVVILLGRYTDES